MTLKRVKHTRQELRALRKLNSVMSTLGHNDAAARDLLEAAIIAMTYYYESNRVQALRDTWNVLRRIA